MNKVPVHIILFLVVALAWSAILLLLYPEKGYLYSPGEEADCRHRSVSRQIPQFVDLLEPETEEPEEPEDLINLEEVFEAEGVARPSVWVRPPLEVKPGQLVENIFNIVGVPSPKAVAFSPDGSEIWVTSLMNKKYGLFVFNAENGLYQEALSLPDGGSVEIVFNKEGSLAYASQMETGRVFEIDVASRKILRTLTTGGSWTKVLVLSEDERKIYASNWTSNNVSEIDLEKGEVIRLWSTVETPRGVYVSKDQKLYVAGFKNGEIQKIDLITGDSKLLFRTGGAMRHLVGSEEKGLLFASDMAQAKIYAVDLKTEKVTEFASTDINPNTIALSPDEKILLVSNRGRNNSSGNYYIPGPEWGSILIFDAESGKMLDALVGRNQPTALAVSPDGNYFVYSNFLDGELAVYRLPGHSDLVSGGGGRSKVYRSELTK